MASNNANSIEKEISKKEMISKNEFNNFFTQIKAIKGNEENVNEQITNKGKSLIKLLDRISEDSKKVDNLKDYVNDDNIAKEIYKIIKEYSNLQIVKKENKEPNNSKLYNYFKTLKDDKDKQGNELYALDTKLQKIVDLLFMNKSILNKSLSNDVYDLVLFLLKKSPDGNEVSEDKKVTKIQAILNTETETDPNNVLNFYKNGLLIIGKLTPNDYYKHLFKRLDLIVGNKNKKSVLDKQEKELNDENESKKIYDSKLSPSKQDDYKDFIAKLFIMVINKCLREKNYMVPLFKLKSETVSNEV
jgi:hypothetical protein